MRWLSCLTLLLFGCGFSHDLPPTAADDAAAGNDDAARTLDGAPDSTTPPACGPGARDFDGDGLADDCDRCPYLADSADPDTDGDGVGDACDPSPTTPGDRRVAWLGMYDQADITGWRNTNATGVWTVADRGLDQTNTLSGLALLDTPDDFLDVYFAARLEVSVFDAINDEIGFCGSDIQPGSQYYCCALRETGAGTAEVRIAEKWVARGAQESIAQAWGGSIAPGATVDVVGEMTATGFSCTFDDHAGNAAHLTGDRGPAASGPAVAYTSTAPGVFRYAFVVAKP